MIKAFGVSWFINLNIFWVIDEIVSWNELNRLQFFLTPLFRGDSDFREVFSGPLSSEVSDPLASSYEKEPEQEPAGLNRFLWIQFGFLNFLLLYLNLLIFELEQSICNGLNGSNDLDLHISDKFLSSLSASEIWTSDDSHGNIKWLLSA